MAVGGLDSVSQALILQPVDAQQVDGVAEFMGQYGLVGVAGLVHALRDAFDVGGGNGSDRVIDHASIAFHRPIHDLSAAAMLGYVIDVLVQPVDGDPGTLGDHGLGYLRRCGQHGVDQVGRQQPGVVLDVVR